MIKEFVQPGGQAYLRLDLGEIEIKRGETEIQIDREREMTLKILSKAG